MNKLIIIGASGHGKVVADAAVKTKKYKEIYFLDDNPDLEVCMGFPVIARTEAFPNWIDEAEYFVAIGNSKIREKIIRQLTDKKAKIATLIHPDACIGMNVRIEFGTVVMAGAVINSDTAIGTGVIINTACSVDHDNRIGDYAHICVGAHLAGTVCVGRHTWIGAGAVVSNNLTVCEECMIGAGAVVVKDIKEGGTYIGVPAKKVK